MITLALLATIARLAIVNKSKLIAITIRWSIIWLLILALLLCSQALSFFDCSFIIIQMPIKLFYLFLLVSSPTLQIRDAVDRLDSNSFHFNILLGEGVVVCIQF